MTNANRRKNCQSLDASKSLIGVDGLARFKDKIRNFISAMEECKTIMNDMKPSEYLMEYYFKVTRTVSKWVSHILLI
jgi:hypothetical protein